MAEISFGEWLKRQRGAKGWTQQQLAQQLSCSTSTLRKMEAEERHPSVQIVERLIEIFHIPESEQISFLQFARGDWQAFSSGEMEDLPWRLSHVAPRSNLPASMTSFIGREKEQEEIIQLIKKNRLVTVAGVGGIGKTRLSLQVGHRLLNQYPDGVWFAALDSLSDPALVTQTVASMFDIREGPERPVIEILKNVLRQKTTLLILDNCEHLLDACAQLVVSLLTNCPKLNILATSRETLNVEGEAIYQLSSLAIPEHNMSLERLTEYESVKLFTERAILVVSSFALTKENAQTVVNICRRVDGIPLAIELAAARVNMLNVEEISKQLQDSLALLASNTRITLPRHQTLQASMNWSWGLLGEAEQIFMQQLSIFAGGWTLEASQAVCDGDVLSLTDALVKKSLIMVDQRPGRETRYRLHEIVHQYACQKLSNQMKEAKIRTRHLKYFSQLAEQAGSALRGSEQVAWYKRLIDERDNIRAALAWADATDVEAGLYIAGRLERFWESFNILEGISWLERFIQKPESKNYLAARASALHTDALLLKWLLQFAKACAVAQECLEICRTSGDRGGQTDSLIVLGESMIFNGEVETGLDLIQQAYIISLSLNDSWRKATAAYSLGYYHRNNSSYWEEAYILFRGVGDWNSLNRMLSQQAFFSVLDGNIESAQKYIDEATSLVEFNKLFGLRNSGEITRSLIALARGDYEQAYTLLMQAVIRADELGNRMSYLWARVHFGYTVLRMGKYGEARKVLTETGLEFLNDSRKAGGTASLEIGVVFSLEGMAELCVAIGKPKQAARLIGWADATRKRINDLRPRLEQGDIDKAIATCLAKMGEAAFADAYDEGQKMSLDEAVELALQNN